MPTRRKTKVVQRVKPKLPANEDDCDMSKEEREAKLEDFLKDFDMEVSRRETALRSQAKQMCNTIDQAFNLEILRLPKNIRDMSYLAVMGENEKQQISENLTNSVEQIVSQIVSSSKTQKVKTESESNSDTTEEAPTQKRKGRQRKTATAKKTTTAKRTRGKKKEQDENEAPETATRPTRQSTRASARKKKLEIATPADRTGPYSAAWDTPFMTPKFDPRLPVTPAMTRKAREGEVLMSFRGSPVVATPAPGSSSVTVDTLKHDVEEKIDSLHLAPADRRTVLSVLQESLQRIMLHTSGN